MAEKVEDNQFRMKRPKISPTFKWDFFFNNNQNFTPKFILPNKRYMKLRHFI